MGLAPRDAWETTPEEAIAACEAWKSAHGSAPAASDRVVSRARGEEMMQSLRAAEIKESRQRGA